MQYIEVVNWEKYNGRKDYRVHWFRLEEEFFDDPKLLDLSAEEMMVILAIFSLQCRHQGRPFLLHYTQLETRSRVSKRKFDKILKKLEQIQIVRFPSGNRTDPIAHNITEQYRTEQEITEQNTTEQGSQNSANADPPLVRIWNENCGDLPRVISCTGTRAKKASARWKDIPDESAWIYAVKKIAATPFLNGKNSRGWRANFDFMLNEQKLTKILEGSYENPKC